MVKLRQLETVLGRARPFTNPKLELEQYATDAHVAARTLYTAATSFDDIKGKDILDLGCGCGMLSLASLFMGAKSVLGVDIDPAALEQCRENINELIMYREEVMTSDTDDDNSDDSGDDDDNDSGDDDSGDDDDNDSNDDNDNASCNDSDDQIDEYAYDINDKNSNDIGIKLLQAPIQDLPNILGDEKKFNTAVLNPPFGTKDNAGIDIEFLQMALRYAPVAYSMHKSSTSKYIIKKIETSCKAKVEVLARVKFEIKRQFKFHQKEKVYVDVDLIRAERITIKDQQ